MTVYTLAPEEFEVLSAGLGEKILRSGSFDIIVGIRTGGSLLADAMKRNNPVFQDIPGFDIELQRRTTPWKDKLLGIWFKRLPRKLLDKLRVWEHKSGMRHSPSRSDIDNALRRIIIDKGLKECIQSPDIKRAIVIDDAVDSGVTLAAVVEYLHALSPGLEITTAVLTVTRNDSVFNPDIVYFNDHRLIRFPWSKDYKPESYAGIPN